ncbi:MAG: hypothetical protein II079_02315, partial [Oscillospiraceae bacterium]|nr:hypothetical protein [Oscillospiraceae bacterium]
DWKQKTSTHLSECIKTITKSKPSNAGSIWRGRKRQPVDVLPFAAAHDLAVFLLTTQRLLQLRSAAGSVLRTELDRPFARPCGATAKDAEKPHDAHKKTDSFSELSVDCFAFSAWRTEERGVRL